MPKKHTVETFIKKAVEIHGNLYDYSEVNYVNAHTPVLIIDPKYGKFWQAPLGHFAGQNHPERGKLAASDKRRTTLNQFIQNAKLKHGNIYNYSKVTQFKNMDEKVCIIDPIYGEFWQSPYQHLNSHGCPQRTKDKNIINHIDHIIPLSIIYSSKRQHTEWVKNRPLYKFLDSDVNKRIIHQQDNLSKGEIITIHGVPYSAGSLRNNYKVIKYLAHHMLGQNIDQIIIDDEMYINEMLNLTII